MANTAQTQQALARDAHFWTRLQDAMVTVAWVVLDEDPATAHHTERVAFARQVTANPINMAQTLALSFVNRPNVIDFETSYDFQVGAVVTASGDPDMQSQLTSDWNTLAGVVA
jgi:hypothetical protein